MKLVKLTGRKTGLAASLIESLQLRGYPAIGYGTGDIDLLDSESVARTVADADVFINNANYKFTQTEIFYALFQIWKDDPSKHIINISSRAAQPNISKGYLYAAQKAALEHITNNIVFNSDKLCKVTTIALGLVRDDYHEALTYGYVANRIVDLIELPVNTEIVHMTIQHAANYQRVQAEKAKRPK